MYLFKKKEEKCAYKDHPAWYGKAWHFLAHEDSVASFIIDAILVVLIGYYIVYPSLGLVFGTSYPVVAVVSDSMDHHSIGFEDWWNGTGKYYDEYNISKDEFRGYYLKNGFSKGDVLVVVGVEHKNLKIGDVIVYKTAARSDPIIHRLVMIDNESLMFGTQGDANAKQWDWERGISPDQINGKAIFLIPKIGWVKVGVVDLIQKLFK